MKNELYFDDNGEVLTEGNPQSILLAENYSVASNQGTKVDAVNDCFNTTAMVGMVLNEDPTNAPTFTDISIATPEFHKLTRVGSTDRLELIEHDHWINGYNNGRMTSNFIKNVQRNADNVSKVIFLSQKMNIRDKRIVAAEIDDLMYSSFTRWLTQEDLKDDRFTNLTNIYCVRDYLGVVDDTSDFIAEFDGFDTFTAYVSKCSRGLISLKFSDITTLAKEIFDKIYESLATMLNYISEYASVFLVNIRDKCINFVMKNILPDMSVFASLQEAKETVVKCIVFVSLALIGALGVVSTHVLMCMMRPVAQMKVSQFAAEADCGNSAVALIMSLLLGAIGLLQGDADRVKKTCLLLTALMAGGNVLANVFSTIFVLLPSTMRTAFVLKFGSESAKQDMKVEDWRVRADGLLTGSKVPTLLGTTFYYEHVKNVVKEGRQLIPYISNSPVKMYFFSTYQKLSAMEQILEQQFHSAGTRKEPFAFHVAGAPGVGKTVLMEHLINRAFNESAKNTYWRSNADDYWSGFTSQEVIIMDEWGIGDAAYRTQTGKEYLALISSSNFTPPMASVDNPIVGIKGTIARPKIVATANNTAYDNFQCVDKEALQRRRKCVILAQRRDGDPNAKLDLGKYSHSDIASAAWAKFAILPGIGEPNWAVSKKEWMDFDALCVILRTMYGDHQRATQNVATALGQGMDDDKTPNEILDEIMRSMMGIVDKPLPKTEQEFAVEDGPPSPEEIIHGGVKCTHNCCKEWTHFVYPEDPDATCYKCGEKGICQRPTPRPEENNQGRVHCLRSYYETAADNFFQSRGLVLPVCLPDYMPNVDRKYKYAGLVAIGISMITGIYYVKRMLFDTEEEITFMGESAKPTKTTRTPRKTRGGVMRRGFKSEGITELPMVQLIMPDGHRIRSTPIYERTVLTYQHSLLRYLNGVDSINAVAELEVGGECHRYDFTITRDNIVTNDEEWNDILLLDISNKRLPQFRDIRKRFATYDQICKQTAIKVTTRLANGVHHTPAKVVCRCHYMVNGIPRILNESLLYDVTSQEGDCGSLLVCVSGPLAGKIIGMHVAGNREKGVHNQGLATIVDSSIFITNVPAEMQTEGPGINFDRLIGPNVERIDYVEAHERVYLPTKSKIMPSELQGLLSVPTNKEPAILDQRDPRANGQSPIENSLVNLFAVEHAEVDKDLVRIVSDSVASQYEQTMNRLLENRELAFEEAVFGIPGVLASLNTTTSAGWPMCRIVNRGKTELFWFDEAGEPHYDEEFKQMVLTRVQEIKQLIKEGDASILHDEATKYHKFIGFLKDETISKSKINNVKTRMIFANDVIAVCAFRMIFGTVLANLNNSFGTTPLAIGYNQYSYDMHEMYTYLVNNNKKEPKFIAGDYKAFDQNMNPEFAREAYRIIVRLAGLSEGHFVYLYSHETQAPAQIGPVLFKTVSNHMSGCFFTSIVNCLVNEMYMRYCFKKRFPNLLFEDNVRCKFLGDDHILAVNPELDWTPLKLGQDMEQIGQFYTSADKDAALRDECDKFDEITFLGSHPRLLHGSYTGAAKKAMLYETPQWTRDNGLSTSAVVRQCCELASQWDQEFFYEYCSELRAAMRLKDVEWINLPGYMELSTLVASRKAGTDNVFVSEGPGVPGLTEIQTAMEASPHNYSTKSYVEHAELGLNEQALGLDYGLNSLVWRETYDWTTSDVRGTEIFRIEAPHGLIALGDPNNLQNIPFQRFIYFHTDVELSVSIAGSPFQAGLLCLSFTPFDTQARGGSTDATQMPHVLLSPNRNPTGTLTIPFRFFRNVMNTYADSQELMGTFTLSVISPLNVNNDDIHVSINIFSRFLNAKFTIPRPVPSAEMLRIKREAKEPVDPMDWTTVATDTGTSRRGRMSRGFGDSPNVTSVIQNTEFVAEGGGASKSSNVNNYNVKNVYDHTSIGGNVPQQLGGATTSNTRAGASVDAQLEVSPTIDMPIPMDNPTLAGSTVPIHPSFSGMSKNRGLKTTTKMGFNHDLDDLHHDCLQEPAETNIASLCARPFVLGVWSWPSASVDGSVIVTWPLNSLFQFPSVQNNANNIFETSTPLAILNKFRFWRADIELEFRAIRTSFHNGRLLMTVGYGAPLAQVAPSNKNIFLNNVLEFVGDNDVVSVTVPYNSATEYITTTQGNGTNNPIQDSSLGTVMITVLNQLKAASTVGQTIELVVYARLKNLEVYEMNPGMTTTMTHDSSGFASWVTAKAATPPLEMIAEGPGETLDSGVKSTDETTQLEVVETTDITATETNQVQNIPYENDYTRKFPCVTRSVYEVIRRYHRLNVRAFTQRTFKDSQGVEHYMLQIPIMPMSEWCNMYGAWAGSLNYRIYTGEPNSTLSSDVLADSISIAINNAVNVEYDATAGTFGPAGDPGWMSGSGFQTQIPANTAYTIDQSYNVFPSVPVEQRYTMSVSKHWIDVNIPFSTIFQILPTPFTIQYTGVAGSIGLNRASVQTGINPYVGWLGITLNSPIVETDCQVFQSVGDDFRFFGYQAAYSAMCPYTVSGTVTLPPGDQINGFAYVANP